jgi:permuted papain-like amidase YaeF/Yiix C92 family enzyme
MDLVCLAESVLALDAYLTELKDRAIRSERRDGLFTRGYLTPSEEMALRQLQLSYWQCRNALFEIIISTHSESKLDQRQPISSEQNYLFLIAYGAAVLLVDAARFLREQAHSVKAIRRKLDEPDPIYGIPDRMYHTVQQSLTSPYYAWRLLQARNTYRQLRPQWVERIKESPWTELLSTIDRLEHRMRPSFWTYLRARLHVRGRQIVRHVRFDVVGNALYRLQQCVSTRLADITVQPGHRPGIPDSIRAAIVAQVRPGDVFVVRKEYAATNYFLPGYWPHAALLVREVSAVSHPVLEAMKDGVRLRPIDSPLASDSVVVLRPRLAVEEIATALDRALSHEGKPYDFDFDFSRSDRMVCTEVVYRAYDGMGEMLFELERHVGRPALGAEALIRMALTGRNFLPHLVYSPGDASDLLTGDQAARVLKQHVEC